MHVTVRSGGRLSGSVGVPGDKSISHRALMFGALGLGPTLLHGLSRGADVRSTASCLRALGIRIEEQADGSVRVEGAGDRRWNAPAAPLDCGNSGTTMRLLAGLLAGRGIPSQLVGDASLQRRPMKRIAAPLSRLGVQLTGKDDGKGGITAPLTLHGGQELHGGAALQGAEVQLEVASAQVKSAVLLAGLGAHGTTRVSEPAPTRDHTERMLRSLGVALEEQAGWLSLRGPVAPWRNPASLEIPGDPSSAAFFLAAAALVPQSEVAVTGVDGNPGRVGFEQVLARMGASLQVTATGESCGDPVRTLALRHREGLRAFRIEEQEVPSLVDEIPLLAVLATQAHGESRITGAAELRVKESDRLHEMAEGLRAMGADLDELPDGLVIRGPTPLHGAAIDSRGDHRIAMSFAVAGLIAKGETRIAGAEWADISFPGFFERLRTLGASVDIARE